MNTFSETTISSGGITSSEQSGSDQVAIWTRGMSVTPLREKFYRGMTAPIRLLPDFLVIGTQRGGTTSFYRYLEDLPCIAPATTKEIGFFHRRFSKGVLWYRGHFPTRIEKYYAQCLRGRAFLTGEASPDYLFHPHAPGRVAKEMPHVKLIVLLRNPVDRAYSHYHLSVEDGHETLSFEEAINGEEERTACERENILKDEHYQSYANTHFSYLRRGIYVDQLQLWMSVFPREQFLILRSEDFYADPATTLKQVLTFLNVPEPELQLGKKEYKRYNNKTSSKMDSALRCRLSEYFEPHNARLYDLLGVDFGWM